jgi:hypothetical protein
MDVLKSMSRARFLRDRIPCSPLLLQLPSLYEEILNHPNTPDDVRREIETKLLSHRQRLLFSIPVTDTTQEFKSRLRNEVEDMVRGTVLLGIPDILAWNLLIESKDAGFIGRCGSTTFGLLLMPKSFRGIRPVNFAIIYTPISSCTLVSAVERVHGLYGYPNNRRRGRI